MAPGGMHIKKKQRFVENHTSFNAQPNSTPRRSARAENDGITDSTPKDNTFIPPKTKAPLTQHQVPRTTAENDGMTDSTPKDNTFIPPKTKAPLTQHQVTQTNSTVRQTKSTARQTNSTVCQTQTSSPKSPSLATSQSHANTESQSNFTHIQTNESEASGRTPQSTENMDDAPYEDDADTDVVLEKPNRRGPTVGRGLIKGLGGSSKKMKIKVDPVIGRPRNRQQSAKFSSQIGVVTRDVLPVMRKWKDIDLQTALAPCVDHMQIYLDVNMDKPGVKESVVERLKISSRQQRHRLHKYYLTFPNMEEAKKKLPSFFGADQQDQWNSLCEFFNSPEFKHRSQVNKENRTKIRAPHATGGTSFSVIQHEMSGKDGPDGDAIEMYLKTHKNDRGWKTEDEEMNWEIMLANQAHYAEEGIEKTEQEIVTEVLGTSCAYVKGLGYAPKPPGKCNSSSSHLQQQLDAAREELKESRSGAAIFKNMVETLKSQLNEQGDQVKEHGAKMDKIMAFFQGVGHSADKGFE